MKRSDRDFAWLSLACAGSIACGLWQWRHGDANALWLSGLVAFSWATACASRVWIKRVERRAEAKIAELDARTAELAKRLDQDLGELARGTVGQAKRLGGGDA